MSANSVTAPDSAIDDLTALAIDTVRAATQVLFGNNVTVEQRQDPEFDEQYFVVRVNSVGRPEDVAQPYREWHRRLGDWAPGQESQFRLAVEIVDEK